MDGKEVVARSLDRLQDVADRLDDGDRHDDVVSRRLVWFQTDHVSVDLLPCETGDVAVPLAGVSHDGADFKPLLADAPGGLQNAPLVVGGECLADLAVDVLGPQGAPWIADAGRCVFEHFPNGAQFRDIVDPRFRLEFEFVRQVRREAGGDGTGHGLDSLDRRAFLFDP